MGSAEGFTYDEAASSCQEQNALLASTGELYAAWKMGFDKCRAGWLVDRSVRYPINNPRAECGAGRPGVHAVYSHLNQTGYPELGARFDAYCFRGKPVHSGFIIYQCDVIIHQCLVCCSGPPANCKQNWTEHHRYPGGSDKPDFNYRFAKAW